MNEPALHYTPEPERTAVEIVDHYLKTLQKNRSYTMRFDTPIHEHALELIEKHGLMKFTAKTKQGHLGTITLNGEEVIKMGGMQMLLDSIDAERKKEQRHVEITRKTAEIEHDDITNAIARSKQSNTIAKCAAILAAIAILISLFKN